VDAGVCGFHTGIKADSDDGQSVRFAVVSDCANIQRLAAELTAAGPVDAYAEIGGGEAATLLPLVRRNLTGCCAGCAVPVGLFKGMQVAAGLALARDVVIRMSKES
jgi:hypothetical protein